VISIIRAAGEFPASIFGTNNNQPNKKIMSIGTIVLILLILMLIGAFPTWRHSKSWGYGPSGGLGLVVVILLILLLTGRI
jgi:hypothetical protein